MSRSADVFHVSTLLVADFQLPPGLTDRGHEDGCTRALVAGSRTPHSVLGLGSTGLEVGSWPSPDYACSPSHSRHDSDRIFHDSIRHRDAPPPPEHAASGFLDLLPSSSYSVFTLPQPLPHSVIPQTFLCQ